MSIFPADGAPAFGTSAELGRRLGDLGELISPDPLEVPITSLRAGNSPRLRAPCDVHVATLADVGELPPIIVHRATMRVVDGVHRVRAREAQGFATVWTRFFEGSDEDAFLLAVRLNAYSELPLTRDERRAAATRLVASHATWSDRALAAVVGLSANTVGAIRRSVTSGTDVRQGRDGRVRPVDGAGGRIRARRVIQERPDASVREIAKRAGISVGTAFDVRRRMAHGLPPVPGSEEVPPAHTAVERPRRSAAEKPPAVLEQLRRIGNDPSLKYSEQGRHLVKVLSRCHLSELEASRALDAVPDYWLGTVADIAQAYAALWQRLADELGGRNRSEDLRMRPEDRRASG